MFSLPFAAYAALMTLVDPFDLLGVSRWVPDSTKANISGRVQYPLWKMIQFRRHPVANILLGDSRMFSVRPEAMREATGEEYFNFGYGGSSLREITQTFWFADSTTTLRNVCIGVNFSSWNGSLALDRTETWRNMNHNPCLYFVNFEVIKSLSLCLAARVTGQKPDVERPPMSEGRFWAYQLEVTAKSNYENYIYPDESFRELQRIAEHCRKRNIRLTFIVFPTHVDLQRRVADFGLSGQQDRFRHDLATLGPVHDFDVDSDLTRDRSNFFDPYHFRKEKMGWLMAQVFGPPGDRDPVGMGRAN